MGFPGSTVVKVSICQCRRCKKHKLNSWVRKIPWSRKWQPTPVFLPGKSHGQRSLVGYSPKSCEESDMTEHTLQKLPHSHKSDLCMVDKERLNVHIRTVF